MIYINISININLLQLTGLILFFSLLQYLVYFLINRKIALFFQGLKHEQSLSNSRINNLDNFADNQTQNNNTIDKMTTYLKDETIKLSKELETVKSNIADNNEKTQFFKDSLIALTKQIKNTESVFESLRTELKKQDESNQRLGVIKENTEKFIKLLTIEKDLNIILLRVEKLESVIKDYNEKILSVERFNVKIDRDLSKIISISENKQQMRLSTNKNSFGSGIFKSLDKPLDHNSILLRNRLRPTYENFLEQVKTWSDDLSSFLHTIREQGLLKGEGINDLVILNKLGQISDNIQMLTHNIKYSFSEGVFLHMIYTEDSSRLPIYCESYKKYIEPDNDYYHYFSEDSIEFYAGKFFTKCSEIQNQNEEEISFLLTYLSDTFLPLTDLLKNTCELLSLVDVTDIGGQQIRLDNYLKQIEGILSELGVKRIIVNDNDCFDLTYHKPSLPIINNMVYYVRKIIYDGYTFEDKLIRKTEVEVYSN